MIGKYTWRPISSATGLVPSMWSNRDDFNCNQNTSQRHPWIHEWDSIIYATHKPIKFHKYKYVSAKRKRMIMATLDMYDRLMMDYALTWNKTIRKEKMFRFWFHLKSKLDTDIPFIHLILRSTHLIKECSDPTEWELWYA